ncbi:hypothetical protein FRUB_00180 [Fimbriiglobus ruber]|uniref:Uncharacterized protein n=2 Tax=Fimbriiglobus ruber TaxID=1908690 RepID=A0A225DYR1_9BACT|nr:hypothetical protein FRUB_00180 [Fimbriiglobus ruber]
MEFDLHPNFYSQFALGYQFLPPGLKTVVFLVKLIVEWFLSRFALPLEIWLRSEWGTRAISLLQLLQMIGLGMMGLAIGKLDLFLALFWCGGAGLAVYRFWESRKAESTQKRAGLPVERHSYWAGEPVLWARIAQYVARKRWRVGKWITEESVARFLEPATALVFALFFGWLCPLFGYVMCCSALALLVKRHLIHMRHVNMERDQADALVLAQYMGRSRGDPKGASHIRHVVRLAPAPFALPVDPRTVTSRNVPPSPAPGTEWIADWLPETNGEAPPSPPIPVKIKVPCPKCGQSLKTSSQTAGHKGKCPKCGERFLVGKS